MKYFLSLLLTAIVLSAAAQNAGYKKMDNGVLVYPATGNSKAVQLKVWSSSTIQVISSPVKNLKEDTSFIIAEKNKPGQLFGLKEEAGAVVLTTAELKAVVSKATGIVQFYTAAGKLIMAEKGNSFKPVQLEKTSSFQVSQQFSSPANEALYGLGQHAQGVMNYKNSNITLYQNNSEVFIPFLVSNKQYGILWDNYSITDFGDGRKFDDLKAIRLYDKNGKPGALTATYLSKKDESKIFTQRDESAIDYPDLQLMTNLPAVFKMDEGKAVYEGYLQAKTSGEHTLRLWAGGYLKVFIDDSLVLDRWRQSWNPFMALLPVQLSKDRKQKFKMEWIPDGGESYLSCKITEPASALQKTFYQFSSEAGDNINYYFVYGKTYDAIISGYRSLTGKVPVMPKWVMGYWQSRERYKTQDEILNTVKTFREKNIPLDNIVMDWQYWKPTEWGSQQFDESRFSNPDSMIDVLHNQYHCKFMISVWPKFYKGIPNFDLMYNKGFLLNRNADENRKDWLNNVSTFYDVYNPAARAQFWELLKNNQYKKNIDSWWMDASEPDIHSNLSIAKRKELFYPTAIGSAIKYFNSYPLLNSQGIYEGQRATQDNKRVFILTRSGFAGIQRYGSAVWSGDIASNWPEMKNQIAAGINFSMSGIPFWTFDAGGFAVEKRFEQGLDKEEWKELQARWYQFGSFLPMFRAHGQFPYREPFNIAGEEEATFKAMKSAIEMRYRLLPYSYSLAADVHFNNGTILKGMMMEFPADKKAETINDQFMCGSSLLVNPVYHFKDRSRKLYLPAGVKWYDFYTNKMFVGGQTINADAPIDHIPVFVKEGSIIITGPVMQYSTEKPADSLTITVYGKKDASFVLYEDENENYNYENGKYASIQFNYNAAKNQLTIKARKGNFESMLVSRYFKIVFAENNTAKAIETALKYSGDEVVVPFAK